MKRYKVIFNPEALVEYVDAVDWYKQRSVKASENFIIDVEGTISQIQENPNRYKEIVRGFRALSLKKYPYSIVYMIDDLNFEIAVSAIYHHKRNPTKKIRKF